MAMTKRKRNNLLKLSTIREVKHGLIAWRRNRRGIDMNLDNQLIELTINKMYKIEKVLKPLMNEKGHIEMPEDYNPKKLPFKYLISK